jgi:hypothetical protein
MVGTHRDDHKPMRWAYPSDTHYMQRFSEPPEGHMSSFHEIVFHSLVCSRCRKQLPGSGPVHVHVQSSPHISQHKVFCMGFEAATAGFRCWCHASRVGSFSTASCSPEISAPKSCSPEDIAHKTRCGKCERCAGDLSASGQHRAIRGTQCVHCSFVEAGSGSSWLCVTPFRPHSHIRALNASCSCHPDHTIFRIILVCLCSEGEYTNGTPTGARAVRSAGWRVQHAPSAQKEHGTSQSAVAECISTVCARCIWLRGLQSSLLPRAQPLNGLR